MRLVPIAALVCGCVGARSESAAPEPHHQGGVHLECRLYVSPPLEPADLLVRIGGEPADPFENGFAWSTTRRIDPAAPALPVRFEVLTAAGEPLADETQETFLCGPPGPFCNVDGDDYWSGVEDVSYSVHLWEDGVAGWVLSPSCGGVVHADPGCGCGWCT